MSIEGFFEGGEAFFGSAASLLDKYIPNLDSSFIYPGGLILALFILPLIILYLIKPKPQKRSISSLMFLMKDTGKSFIRTFFQTFIRDVLFFIQLLAIILLVLAVARPFINVPEIGLDKPTVIIIDGSASMQAQSRFDDAKDIAKDSLSIVNTVILAKNLPQTVAIEQGGRKTATVINDLNPAETETNLYDALILAPKYLRADGRVVVISDFATDTTYLTAKKFVESQGHTVHLKKVGSDASNVGIVDLEISEKKTAVSVKNFNDKEETVRLKVNDELMDTLKLGPESSDLFSFSTPPSTTEISIDVDDDYDVDNKAYISAPQDHSVSVLVVTNDHNLRNFDFVIAMDAINSNSSTKITYELAHPPKMPTINHDIVIFKNLDTKLILPGTIDETIKKVKNGGACIVMIQDALFDINFKELLPYTYVSTESEALIEKSDESLSLTENVEFGTIGTYYVVKPNEGVISIASVGDSPVVGFKTLGKGIVMYYGIYDESADFSKEPYYPIFWKRTIDFLTGKPELAKLNYRTGKIISLDKKQDVGTPHGSKTVSSLILENTGFYTLSDRKIASNMLSVTESDINSDSWTTEVAQENIDRKPSPEPFDLSRYAIIAALLVIGIELLYLKFRGDL
ncbi:MAG: VWA domain-containing protein [Nanoarchaeota archaeon]|nr:VWA domain-containing protein [Nanoarchaeota archaeon]